MSTLILLRHGHSEWNAKNLFTGWVDVDLNEQGVDEAHKGASMLAEADLLHQLWRAHFLEGADIGDPYTLATRAALLGLELETAEALLASTEYADEVRTQDEVGASLEVAQLPYVAIEQRWTLVGVQSQNDYVQALHQIYTEWKAEPPSEE